MWVQSLGWEDPLEEGTAAHSVFLPGESQGQRSLVGVHRVTKSQTQLKRLNTHSIIIVSFVQIFLILHFFVYFFFPYQQYCQLHDVICWFWVLKD